MSSGNVCVRPLMESSIARIEPIRSRSGGDRRIGRSKGGRRSQGPLLDSPSMPRRLSLHPPMLGSRRSRCFTFQTGLALVAIGAAGWFAVERARRTSGLDAVVLRFAIPSARAIHGLEGVLATPPATANLGDELRTAWPARPGSAQDLIVELVATPEDAAPPTSQKVEFSVSRSASPLRSRHGSGRRPPERRAAAGPGPIRGRAGRGWRSHGALF